MQMCSSANWMFSLHTGKARRMMVSECCLRWQCKKFENCVCTLPEGVSAVSLCYYVCTLCHATFFAPHTLLYSSTTATLLSPCSLQGSDQEKAPTTMRGFTDYSML